MENNLEIYGGFLAQILTFKWEIISRFMLRDSKCVLMDQPMEIDSQDGSCGSIPENQENAFHLYPVSVNDEGEGLPYAPEDWPNPGDNWRWKVGRRVTASGHFLDRYIYPPKSLQDGTRKKKAFKSRLSVMMYIQQMFPNADVNAFFASFCWRIPSKQTASKDNIMDNCNLLYKETVEPSVSDSQIGILTCKAGNRMCSGLIVADPPSEVMSCDICCSEPGFCRDCCCILCCKSITAIHGGYSYFKCEALVGDYICGHVVHINCGLRAYLAGTVGGSIRLDAEYYCRRCDSRSDLVSHVAMLLKTCESIKSRDDIEEILCVGLCILQGSKRTSANQLSHCISLALAKLKSGKDLEDVWRKEDVTDVIVGELPNSKNGNCKLTDCIDSSKSKTVLSPVLSSNLDHRVESLVLENEIDQVLLALKKSQESEYRIAEKILTNQRDYIQNLFQQLDQERTQLSRHTSSTDADAFLEAVLRRVEQIKQEVLKLKDMKEVAEGFGRTSKHILKEHFGIQTDN